MKLIELKTLREDVHGAFEKWENMLHHIAEEELVACKVLDMELSNKDGTKIIKFIADCNDDPRKEGYQPDLSIKLNERFKKHDLVGLSPFVAKVYHSNKDPR